MAKNKDDNMPNNEFGQLVAYLTNTGFEQTWIESIIGQNPNGRTRAEIAEELRTAMKTLPKG